MHSRIPTLITAAMLLGAAQAQDGGVYQAENGLLVAEIESHPAAAGWAVETTDPDYTFQSYYRWDGGNLFNTPGSGSMTYRVNVDQGGFWRLSLRNKHDHPDDTEENDVWIRADGGTWFKLFSNGPGTVDQWNWVSKFDIAHDNQPDAGWGLAIGEHTIEFSGRSQNFKMDRFHLYKEGHPDGENENAPESVALIGESYCGPGNPNSTGQSGEIDAWGSTFVAKNDVTLAAAQLPASKFGYFIASDT
ncbi:MAG: hypothetical protein O2816_09965, partial [Planctomycetota bacterium]|nr:hypothetical protein [Planctomycetota bacterium]